MVRAVVAAPQPPPPTHTHTHLTTHPLPRAERRGLYYGFPRCHTQGYGDPYLRPLGPGKPIPDPSYNENLNCEGEGW